MNNTIQYKGYVGSVEFSEEDGIFYGKVMGIRSLFLTRVKVPGNFWTIFTMLSMIIWKPARQKERNPKSHLKAVSISAFLLTFTKSCSFIQQPIRCLPFYFC